MDRETINRVWASAEYEPTAQRLRPIAKRISHRVQDKLAVPSTVVDIGAGHGDVALALSGLGYHVLAIEPVERMRCSGLRRTGNEVEWINATGEETGLPDNSVDAIASNFGAFLCDPKVGPLEWARILRPGGILFMTAWDDDGFLAEMTRRMMTVMFPDGGGALHMNWGSDNYARSVLAPYFESITISHERLSWNFESVEAGMRLYRQGSPTHTFSMKSIGERSSALEAVLEQHLRDEADVEGKIRSFVGYSMISARVGFE
ncbi:class I SAM-dependent methyltransferase [Arcanobacterium ihumii]|uniref:class I SAM-dependent methyltransferase n=1 Tax=Arcanobacterium ihumii TaxID=2138162 RepID=UPI00135C4B0E|nr:class I SAM-dependent methyltransferase [Arcanobacterium ihumii]